jgi:two-component system phosphate regulon sensor histidine kinase PhoR
MRMRGGFRTKLFLATCGVAAGAVVLAATLVAVSLRRQTYERIERGLITEARLAADLLSHRIAATSPTELQEEVEALDRHIGGRVTFIAADGRVIADSSQDEHNLSRLENHGSRPEVVAARHHGIGIDTRPSATLGIVMLYVATPVRHPSIAFVRIALPSTDIRRQLQTVWQAAAIGLAVSVVGGFALAWVSSALLVRRLNRLAARARSYAAGHVPAAAAEYDRDEIGTVAEVLDDAMRRLGERAAELARDRAHMQAILAGMVEGVVLIDGGERIQLVNEAAERMLRLDGSALGRTYRETLRDPVVLAQVAAALERERAPDHHSLIDDSGRVFIAHAAPVGQGEGGGAVLVLHEVTDLHRADQVRRDFVANVSHELRTPLTAIRGYTEALRDDPTDPEERQRYLDIIARHANRMERLVNDLLRLARLDAGQERPEYAPCPLDGLFADVVADLLPMITARKQRVQFAVEPAVAVVNTDAAKLHDALRNLVENAVIYSPEGGLVTLTARARDDRVILSVCDEGPGIPPADLSRVFERFYRVDKARSRASGGTGLGLAIVKHLVGRMEGTIFAANRREGGAEFTISLPFTPTAQPAA